MREITDGAGARIIFDPIAGSLLDKLADAAAPGATIFQYGWLPGEPTPFSLIPALQKALTHSRVLALGDRHNPRNIRKSEELCV